MNYLADNKQASTMRGEGGDREMKRYEDEDKREER
jgi:hypothetical protein